jgi:hypothetical protein
MNLATVFAIHPQGKSSKDTAHIVQQTVYHLAFTSVILIHLSQSTVN